MPTDLRPLTLGELLDRSFYLYRTNFALFVGIVALPQLFVLAVQLSRPNPVVAAGDVAATIVSGSEIVLWSIGVILASLIVGAATQGATVVALSEVYLGRTTGIATVYSLVIRRLGLLIVLTLVVSLAVMGGLILLIVPGIIVALALSLVVPVAMIEGLGVRDTLSRSRFLTRGFRWRILVTGVLYFVLLMVVSTLWQVPVGIASVVAARGGTPGELPAWAPIVSAVGSYLTQSLVGPLMTITLSLIYYDVRVRKEAFDLEHMMARLGQPGVDTPIVGT